MSGETKNPPAEFPAAAKVARSEDLVLEILKRLPTKSLIKFELVSKQWLHLISSPEFARVHTRLNPMKSLSGLFFYDSLTKSQSITSLPLINPNTNLTESIPSLDFVDPTYKLVQSCNGLLLYRSASISSSDPIKILIVNPTTRQSREFPQPVDNGANAFYICCGLAYDPSLSLHYKVVRLRWSDNRQSSYHVHVYSSEDGSWRTFSRNMWWKMDIDFESGAYWNGAIHWASSRGICFYYDLNSERLDSYQLPRSYGAFCRYFGRSRDCMYYFKVSRPSAKEFEISEIRRRDYVFTELIYIPHLVSAYPEIAITTSSGEGTVFAFSVVGVVAGALSIDRELILRIPGKVISYNYCKKELKELINLPGELTQPMEPSYASCYEFVETLVPV